MIIYPYADVMAYDVVDVKPLWMCFVVMFCFMADVITMCLSGRL